MSGDTTDDASRGLDVVRQGLAEIEAGRCPAYRLDAAVGVLGGMWDAENLGSLFARETGPAYAPSSDRWQVAWTENFYKDTRSTDRKLQGRLLEALGDITKSPVTLRGDTVKPLHRDFKGCWRYRIGDYRLVYYPRPTEKVLVLIAFSSRGDVYSD